MRLGSLTGLLASYITRTHVLLPVLILIAPKMISEETIHIAAPN